MQKTNDMVLKRRVFIDNKEIPGLVSTSDLKDTEGTVDVPGFNRKVTIKEGVKKFEPLDLVYKISANTNTQSVFNGWFQNDELHDVTVINTDATGTEVNRWALRACECAEYSERAFNAAGVEFFGIAVKITCSQGPDY